MTQNYKLPQKVNFFFVKMFFLTNLFLIIFNTASFAQCGSISTLPCPNLIVALPYKLDFTGTEGGLKDSTTKDIGFRMVQAHSQPRLTEDLPVSNATISGYEKKWLEVRNTNLEITANKGTNFVKPATADANTQVNALGVGIQQTNTEFEIETTTIYLNTGGGNAYAGLWYGLDEDNYVRLVILSTTVEFRIEKNGISNFATDRIASPALAGVLTNPVKLRMVVNNTGTTKKVKAYYRAGNLPEQYLGELVHTFANGITLADGATQNVAFAGFLASYRTGTKFIATFDEFKLTPVAKALSFAPDVLNVSLNYETSTTTNISALIEPRGFSPTSFTLSKPNGTNWLTLPNNPILGNLNFGVNATGLLPGTYSTTVTAKAPNGEGFADGKLKVTLKVLPKTLTFSVPEITFSGIQNGTIAPQIVSLTPENGTPLISFSKDLLGDWLGTPANPATGNVSLNAQTAGLLPGSYQTILTAKAAGYADAKLKVNLIVEEAPLPNINWLHRINFMNNITAPTGFIKDIGQPYGDRGNGRIYGWIDPSFGTPKSVVNYARNRADQTNFTLEQRTLNQMQILGFEANWEMELPNGAYYVKIISGDCSNSAGDLNGHHVINAEGIKMIDFVQGGVSGFQEKVQVIHLTDGKLTLNSLGGTRTKISSIQIGKVTTANDNIAPSVKFKFEGTQEVENVFVNQVRITIDTMDLGISGIDLLEFSLNGAAYQPYTTALFINEAGNYTISAKAKDRNNNLTITPYYHFKVQKPSSKNVRMVIENFYKFPDNDNYTFSFIQKRYTTVLYGPNYECPDYNVSDNYNHDSNEIRVYNYGTEPLIINELVLSDEVNFKITRIAGVKYENYKDYLPIAIQPNTFVDITVIFTTRGLELDLATRVKLYHATLTIKSNDSAKPNKILNLHAIYQEKQEGGQEPTTQEFIEAIGFKTNTGFTTANNNHAYPIGDEVFTSYFVRADTNKNAYMRLFASYHTLPSTAVMKYRRKGNTNNATTNLLTHTNKDSQTLLPRKNGTLGIGDASFLVNFNGNKNYPFAIKLATDDTDPLFSDTYVQYQATSTYKDANGNPFRGARVWKAVNFEGKVIPNAYIIAHDYLYGNAVAPSSNFDYNDNAVYVENIRPEIGTAFYSELKGGNGIVGNAQQNQSSLDFGSAVIGTSNQLTLNLRSLGLSYANGSIDPPINIEKVEIEGANYDEFLATNPIKMQLNAGENTTMQVKFNPALVGLKNAILLIHHNFGNSPLRVPLYAIATSPCYNLTLAKRIKSAVDADVTIDGVVWEKDNTYRKNATGTGNNLVQLDNITVGSTDIQLTDRDNLYIRYMSSRQNLVGVRYEIPVNATGNGKYLVRLHFSENFWTEVNRRVNDIYIEGQLKLPAFDIFREAGYRTATFRDFEIDIADNKLDIKFVSLVNRPSICGVEIYNISSNSPLTLNSTLITPASCGVSDGSIQVAATGVTNGTTVSYKLGKYGVYQSSGTFSNLKAGEYTIYVKENIAGGCEAQKTFVVPQNDSFIAFITAKTPTSCGANYDGSANIINISGGIAPYAITWNTPQPQFGSIATGLDNGTVTFTITDASGCSKLGSIQIDSCNVAPNNIPVVSNAINDVNVFKNASPTVIDLSAVFTDADIEPLVKTVIANSNTNAVTTTLVGNTLTLNYVNGASGTANIIIRATDQQGAIANDEFKVTITAVDIVVNQIEQGVLLGSSNQRILKILIDEPANLNLSVSSFKFNTIGTSNTSDIVSAKLYHTGNSQLFLNPTQIGSEIDAPNGEFTFSGFNFNLVVNANYFWLVYELEDDASVGNTLDAALLSVQLNGNEMTPDNGNPAGSRSIRTTDATPGKMLTFDGTNDYVELPNEERFDFTNAMTVETWIKVGAFNSPNQPIISKGNTWILRRQNTSNFASFRFLNSTNGVVNVAGNTTNINDGKWHHVAGVYNGTQAILYVDGKIEGTANYNGSIAVDNRPVFIGSNAQETAKFFNGKMDEVRIWNVARTQTQIREQMHLTLQGTETGLVSYLQFNQDNGTIAPDLVGGSDGTLKNMLNANWTNANQPIAKGVSQTATPAANSIANFDNAGLRITFGNVFPNGNIVVSRLENVSPAGTEVATGKIKTSAYWVINNFGTNTGYSPMTLRFYVNDGILLSTNPSDYKLYKRGSRDDEETWNDVYDAITVNSTEKYIEFAGITNFSQAIIAGADASLPIRLVSFDVNRLNENTAKLEWTTALEENNKGFEIQKSFDGSSFDVIGFADGAGNSVQIKNYSFLDQNATDAAYYRLKQIDFDGKFQYSPIQYLQGMAKEFIELFPNPTQDFIDFKTSEDIANHQNIQVILTDSKGMMLTQKIGNIHQIKQTINQKLIDLRVGLYFVKITADNRTYLLRLVKQ